MQPRISTAVYIPLNVNTGALLDEKVRRSLTTRLTTVVQNIANRDIIDLRGVGPVTQGSLNRIGVRTLADFVTVDSAFLPSSLAGIRAALEAAASYAK